MALEARTPRQEQIRELYYDGLDAREIGRRLGMTRRSVYRHLAAMRQGPSQGTTVCGCLMDYLSRPLEESDACPHQVAV